MGEYSSAADLTLSQLEPFVLGKDFIGKPIEVVRGNQDIYNKFLKLVEEYEAQNMLAAYEHPANFYDVYPDFKHEIPKEYREEVFYEGKNGCMYKEIPAQCVYVLKKVWNECNGIPNLILKTVPTAALTMWLRQGYFLGAVTLKDAICNVCTPLYKPLCETRLRNKVGTFTEIYVVQEDMVAAVPNSISNSLGDENIRNMKLGQFGLEVDGILVRTMAGYVGAINSNYDLRELL